MQLRGWVRKFYRKAILREFGCPEGVQSARAFQRRWEPLWPFCRLGALTMMTGQRRSPHLLETPFTLPDSWRVALGYGEAPSFGSVAHYRGLSVSRFSNAETHISVRTFTFP